MYAYRNAAGNEKAGNKRSGGRKSRMAPLALMIAAGAAVLTVSGCAKHSKDHFTVGSVPDDYRTRHPIKIAEREQTLDIPVGSAAYELSVPTKSAITGFAGDFKRSANGAIRIMVPYGAPNEHAASGVASQVAETLAEAGVQPHRIARTSYDASQHGAAAPIRLSYHAVSANVDGCGKWDEDLTETTENKQYHNFGCASQNNLASIVSNPADLLGPRGQTETDAIRRANVIDNYQQGIRTNSDDNVTTIRPTFRDG